MKPLYKHIPNLLTLTNGLFGALSVYMYLTVSLQAALICLVVSLLADVLDGFVARALGAVSPIGVDLDSLSDVLSFGATPALLLALELMEQGWSAAWVVLLIVPASIYRLAKFNHDTRQTHSFLGLSTTANAALIAPLLLMLRQMSLPEQTPVGVVVLVFLTLLDAWLLVSEVPFFGLKRLSEGWRANLGLIVVVIVALAAVLAMGFRGLFWAMLAYVLINLYTWLLRPHNQNTNRYEGRE